MLVEIRYIFFPQAKNFSRKKSSYSQLHSSLAPVHGALILFLAGNCLSPTAYIAKHYLFNAANPPSGVTFSPWFCHFWETLAQEFPQANGTFHLCFPLVPTIFKASVSFLSTEGGFTQASPRPEFVSPALTPWALLHPSLEVLPSHPRVSPTQHKSAFQVLIHPRTVPCFSFPQVRAPEGVQRCCWPQSLISLLHPPRSNFKPHALLACFIKLAMSAMTVYSHFYIFIILSLSTSLP